MVDMEITDGPAVADHMAFESPFVPQGILQECLAAAGRFAVYTVIGAHDGFNFGFLHRGFKSRQVCFGHILRIGHRVEFMAEGFRAGMHGKMLAAGGCFQIFPVALEAFDIPDSEPARQVRIFAVGLMSAAPAGIPEDVDVRTPYGEPFIDIPVAETALPVVFRARFIGNGRSDLFLEVFVKHGGQADCLRKNRRGTCPGDPVQRFIPPVVGRNTQARDCGCVISELGRFFLQCHSGYQFLGLSRCLCPVSHSDSPIVKDSV